MPANNSVLTEVLRALSKKTVHFASLLPKKLFGSTITESGCRVIANISVLIFYDDMDIPCVGVDLAFAAGYGFWNINSACVGLCNKYFVGK